MFHEGFNPMSYVSHAHDAVSLIVGVWGQAEESIYFLKRNPWSSGVSCGWVRDKRNLHNLIMGVS